MTAGASYLLTGSFGESNQSLLKLIESVGAGKLG